MNSVAWSVLSFFLGLWLGHRLAIGRDKRREFNQAAQPIRKWLLEEIEKPGSQRPSNLEFDNFRACLSRWRRPRFERAYGAFMQEFQIQMRRDNLGGLYFEDEDAVREAARSCLRFTNKK